MPPVDGIAPWTGIAFRFVLAVPAADAAGASVNPVTNAIVRAAAAAVRSLSRIFVPPFC